MPTPTTSLWSDTTDADAEHPWLDSAQPAATESEIPLQPAGAPRPPRRGLFAVGALAALALVAALAAVVAVLREDDGGLAGTATAVTPLPAAAGANPANRVNEIYERVGAGVVSIVARSGSAGGSGTGFVIRGDGTIVTNAHVVNGATDVRVRFDERGPLIAARLIGTDPSSDLAVLRVDPAAAPALRPLTLADSDAVKVGDTAIAIGYPLGLDRTATAGIVSGLGREIRAPNGFTIDEVIQTDAPINPGNSGGPLLDLRGRVIGVNSQIATAGSAGNVGIGFAVPSNTVRDVVPRLERGLSIKRPYLGVSTGSPTGGGKGALVAKVVPGGPAERAGVRGGTSSLGTGGDVIVEIDGKPVTGPDDVGRLIANRAPGDRVELVVERDGARRTLKVELGERPDQVP